MEEAAGFAESREIGMGLLKQLGGFEHSRRTLNRFLSWLEKNVGREVRVSAPCEVAWSSTHFTIRGNLSREDATAFWVSSQSGTARFWAGDVIYIRRFPDPPEIYIKISQGCFPFSALNNEWI